MLIVLMLKLDFSGESNLLLIVTQGFINSV